VKTENILVVDDDKGYQEVVSMVLEDHYNVKTASCAEEALALLETNSFDLVLMDIMMPGMTGIEALKIIKSRWPGTEVIIITVIEDKDNVVNVIKNGAYDYIIKGCSPEDLLNRVSHLFEKITNSKKLKYLLQESKSVLFEDMLIGPSKASQKLIKELNLAANCDALCMLTGETGTGKDLAARFIHRNSARAEKPFVVVNLPAIPKDLVESILFGHERGAFTGAIQSQEGKFELADGGTIFLDEIGDLPLEHQMKLLRVIEDGEIERVGSNRKKYCNVRIITATSHQLEELIQEGAFRQDLYYRLKVMPIYVPALRERLDDIRPLTVHFLNVNAKKYGKKVCGCTNQVFDTLEEHAWKGNIRELSHLIERMIIYIPDQKEILDISDLPLELLVNSSEQNNGVGMVDKKDEFEKQLILRALVRNNFNRSSTARELKIPVETLRYRIKKFGISLGKLEVVG